jgi:hypothetical protein
MGASIKLEPLQRLSWIVPLAVPQSSARRSLAFAGRILLPLRRRSKSLDLQGLHIPDRC